MKVLAGRFTRLTIRQRLLLLTVVAMFVMPLAAFAQTPVPPMTPAEIITAGSAVINDFGLMPFITVSAIVGVAIFLFVRVKRGAR